MESLGPTYCHINLKSLRYNFLKLRRMLPEYVRILATVKQDAYGHGIIEVSRTLERLGVDYLGIARLDEACNLRKEKIKVPLFNLSVITTKEEARLVKKLKITPAVSSLDNLFLLKTQGSRNPPLRVHLKLDTGMTRLGASLKEAKKIVKAILKDKDITLEGIFTHFPVADTDRVFTLYQIKIFEDFIRWVRTQGLNPLYLHCANSAAILRYKKSYFNLVRPGLCLYGINPMGQSSLRGFKPVMEVKTKIIFLRKIDKGVSVSYQRAFISPSRMQVGVLPIGYGDGLPFTLSSKGAVLIKGRRFPIIGRVCMDFIMVGLPWRKRVKINEEAVIMGTQGRERILCEEIASLCKTIPYEILCRFGKNLPRLYSDQ